MTKEEAMIETANDDCLMSDWLFPCWGSPRAIDKPAQSADETSYSSDSTSAHPNKEGEILEAKPADDVSDVTSTPSEDCSEESEDNDDCSSVSSPCPYESPKIGLEVDDALSVSSEESL